MQYSLLYRFSFFLVKNCVGYNIQFFLYSLNIIIVVYVNIFKYSHLAYFFKLGNSFKTRKGGGIPAHNGMIS